MTRGFVHSVKVPRLYKAAAKILQEVHETHASLKSLTYSQRHPNVSAIYSLCLNALQKKEQLNQLLNKTHLLMNEPRLDPWLARILITELLWGKKVLKAECRPVQTIRSYENLLKDELSAISNVQAPETSIKQVRKARYVRINTLLLPLKKGISYFEEEGWSLLPTCSNYTEHLEAVKNLQKPHFIQDFHVPELLVFPVDTTFHDNSRYLNGELILQDKASCLPAKLLNPKPGSVVLDMCAAPGMKSTHLAALMNNLGKIYAVELNEHRYASLCEQVKLTGASCINAILKDAVTLNANEYSDVEYILVDPSCSGSGMLDRQAMYGDEKLNEQRLKRLQAFQVFLLRHALLNFPNVKRVVYSTCSINQEENEEVIDEILTDVQDAYALVNIKDLFKENWLHYSSEKFACSSKCLYSNLEVDLCNGFFVAVFERNVGVPLPPYRSKFSTNNEQLTENGESNVKEPTATRKRKKRGKRRSMNFVETPIEDNFIPLESGISSPINVSSDSIVIVDEISANEVEEIEPDFVVEKKKIEPEPVVKKKKIQPESAVKKKKIESEPIVKKKKVQPKSLVKKKKIQLESVVQKKKIIRKMKKQINGKTPFKKLKKVGKVSKKAKKTVSP
nr:probable 28S rRNA (cytosine-C(5))-methyltransferase isoform X1 [Osmia lignaria]